jgi:ribosomal-protein-alanine N-acetyltransferase
MKKIKFIRAEVNHLDAIIKVENKCFTAPWTINMFLSELYGENALLYILMENNVVVGYISLFKIFDELHVNNIAVDPSFQGKGYASMIMEKTIEIARNLSIAFITLEARKSNTPAVELYKKYGFETLGSRKNYYKTPKEDALIMTKELI